ncbi:hypothetical protein KUV22_00770 [Microbulbifer agarilyticus]|uniref:hypothetical protein n=1 Tax=Microbulbifer agarilyticus TaxID=260552 RepID=UPI001C982834|nr:hypothetical protein [Microbulbifer agarilyticus]MBY6188952.1 hypothetical protein [Microbulbifer agarilyticus]
MVSILGKLRSFFAAVMTVVILVGCGGSSESEPPAPEVTEDVADGGSDGGGNDDGDTNTTEDPVTVAENKLGAWIWYIDEAGLVRGDHASMAQYLAGLGVKRVFIKISDINYQWEANKITFQGDDVDCGVWQDACEPENLQFYRDAGIEPWAWTYNDVHSFAEQADMLEAAVRVGYAGYVLDIEEEYNGVSDDLHTLLSAHRNRLETLGDIVSENFLLTATSWGNPQYHGMRIDIIDEYVDAHMPQTYIEKWGSDFILDIPGTIAQGDCEYRELGATKPVWHIVSHEDKLLTADQLNEFVRHAGPHASVWRMSSDYLQEEIEAVDWDMKEFQPNECTQTNFDID